jgi:hypothetical protein
MWCLHKSLCPSRCLSHREGVFGYLTPRNPGWEKNKTVAPLSETRGCSSIYKYQNCFSLHPMHPFYSQPINWHLPLAPPNHNRAVQYNWPVGLQRIENQACQSPGSTHHGTTCDCCHHLSVEILLHLREVLGTGTYELGATAACLFVCLFFRCYCYSLIHSSSTYSTHSDQIVIREMALPSQDYSFTK